MEELAEGERIVTVNIYDAHASNANFKVKPTTTAADICKIILSKRDILSSESRFFSIVLVISAFNSFKKCDTHCLRTLNPEETFFGVQRTIISKMASKYGQSDESKLENGSKWYFKDMRTNPIELGAAAEICGEYSSDEDEAISQSDLSYLAKSERKGYLLKRSNSDFNLWRRWYCVLMDQLWCVDISREVPRAKCVKLSGMIRYREGYKTLDQLQIIIINSPDSKSHFFRAFNLIDQRKWIQDLNIKTRVAAENDSFSMAEMIITDEEDAKNFRLTRQIGEVLDQPKAMEALAFRSAVDFMAHDTTHKTTLDAANCSYSQKSQTTINGMHSTEAPSTTPRKAVADPSQLISPMQSPSGKNGSFIRIKQNINDPIAAAPVIIAEDVGASESVTPLTEEEVEQAIVALAGRNVSVTECTRFTHPRACSCVNLQNLEVCERVENHCLMHELHKDSRSVTEVLLFVIAVQKYKEILRRELYMPLKRQQNSALRLYVKFILPQLLFTDLTQYPDFSDESMQLNSAAGVEANPQASKNKTNSGTSGKYGAESPKRPRNRSQSQVPSETAATPAPSEPATVHWHLDPAVLMRVHAALFAMHTRTVELRNALVTQDPSQLVKYGAGSSKFRARDRSVSTAHHSSATVAGLSVSTTAAAATTAINSSSAAPSSPVPAPAGSFWPWFGFGGPSPSITPPPSRKGSDAQALAAAASAKETAAAVALAPVAPEFASTSGKVSPAVAPISVEKERTEEGTSEKNSSAIPPSPITTPSPQQTSAKSMSQKNNNKESVLPIAKSEEQTEKSPSVELFDEVVAALLQKLN